MLELKNACFQYLSFSNHPSMFEGQCNYLLSTSFPHVKYMHNLFHIKETFFSQHNTITLFFPHIIERHHSFHSPHKIQKHCSFYICNIKATFLPHIIQITVLSTHIYQQCNQKAFSSNSLQYKEVSPGNIFPLRI